MFEKKANFFQLSAQKVITYFALLTVSFHDLTSLFGFFTFLLIFSQLISGTMLAFSLVPEPMLIPMVRDEEDIEDLYADDFFWLHERGVDFIFIFSYLHLFRKLYLNVFEYENAVAWQSGVFTFLIFQVVVFLGLVLCCTHLSEITLTIAANIFHTFFAFKGKFYWWIFTDKQLNVDTTIRLAYGHYVSAFLLAYLGLVHGIDMHYDWKNETSFDGMDGAMVWWDEALTNELGCFLEILVVFTFVAYVLFEEPEALSYEIFMWGDIGLMSDVRFYGVAPHWYFRPFMAWLITCPHHKTGIFGLLFYFFCLFYQPSLHGVSEQNNYNKRTHILFTAKLQHYTFYTSEYTNWETQIYHHITYGCFVACCFYVSSFLPYGRFYNRLGGNIGALYAYMYIFLYLALPVFRKPLSIELYMWGFYTKLQYLNGVTKVKIV